MTTTTLAVMLSTDDSYAEPAGDTISLCFAKELS